METVNTSPLFSYAAAAALSNGSLYRDRTRDRDELLAFMDANEWFGSSYEQNGDEFMVVMTAEIKNAVSIWINAYRRTNDEKVEILLTLLEKTFPQISQRFRRYMASEGKGNERSTWKVLDFMAASLKKELDEYSEEEIKELTASAYSVLKMKELSLFHAFLSYGGEGKPYTDWNYQFKSHQLVKADNTAYAIKDFALMAYIVLNQDAWSENHLVEKALDNRRYAELWMFSALHFICALRTTDIVRLPVPALPYDAETIREKIREGSFSDADAYGIAFELQFRCRMRSSRPHKTLKKGISPEIKLFIPESLHVPLGFIMAIALSFRSEDDPLSVQISLCRISSGFLEKILCVLPVTESLNQEVLTSPIFRELKLLRMISQGIRKDICWLPLQGATRAESGNYQRSRMFTCEMQSLPARILLLY